MKRETKDIPIEKLEIDPCNIRQDARADQLMVESIKDLGILHMPIVRPRPGGMYGVVVGARRFTGAKNAGEKSLRCDVRKLSDIEAIVLSMTENRHRKDISPGEWLDAITKFYRRLSGDRAERIRKIRDLTKHGESTVREYLDISGLPAPIKAMVKEPSQRSDSEKEALEKIAAPRSEEKAPIGERGKEEAGFGSGARGAVLFPGRYWRPTPPSGPAEPEAVPQKVMAKLARDRDFRRWSKKSPERALKVAVEATKRGQAHVEEVVDKEKERLKPASAEKPQKYPHPPAIRVNLGQRITEGLKKYAKEENIIDLCTAIRKIVARFLEKGGYLEL